MKWMLSCICLLIAGFCLFGFLATFELGVAHALTYRLVYGAVGLASLATVVASIARSFGSPRGPDRP